MMDSRHLEQRVLDVLLFLTTLAAVAASLVQTLPDWVSLAALLSFVALYFVRWHLADDRRAWIRHNWPDLLLVVVLASPVLRLLAAFRVVGLVPAIKIGAMIRANRKRLLRLVVLSAESLPVAMTTMSVIVFGFGTAAFLIERPHNPAFAEIADGLWWAFVTMTTVGYGDIYPITPGGRIIGVFTMIFGITVYSLLIANLTVFVEEHGRGRRKILSDRGNLG